MAHATTPARLLLLLFSGIVIAMILRSWRGGSVFIRRIPGLSALDEAVGRAIEMGRPILMSPGMKGLEVETLQALAILTHVAKVAARYGNRVLLPNRDASVFPIAEEAVRGAYADAGREDLLGPDDVSFLSNEQFAYAAGVAGIVQRERVAATFLFGYFYAESLIISENANMVGAIQIAGTPSTTQIPFLIASCDYVIIGDEFYAATAYLTREKTLLGSIVGQDICKGVILLLILLGVLFISFNNPFFYNLLGSKDLPWADYFKLGMGG